MVRACLGWSAAESIALSGSLCQSGAVLAHHSLLEEQETLDRTQIEAALGDLRAAQSVVVGER